MGDLSPHFTRAEFACKHCQRCVISIELVNALEKLREEGMEPIVINDGYRCAEHNLAVGGVPDSEHVLGIAADIKILGLSLQQQYDRANKVPEFRDGGIGAYYEGFLHVDVRKKRARWARIKGVKEYVALERLITPLLSDFPDIPTSG